METQAGIEETGKDHPLDNCVQNLAKESGLRADVLKADLDAHRNLETWGSSLFLGALGLLAKQLMEWDLGHDPNQHIALRPIVVMSPAIVGLVAFIFLRVVNSRSHSASVRLNVLAGVTDTGGQMLGTLGWILALMPGLLGYLISWSLCAADPLPNRWTFLAIFIGIGVATFLYALVKHCNIRAEERAKKMVRH